MEFHTPSRSEKKGYTSSTDLLTTFESDLAEYSLKRRSLLQPRPKSALGLSSVRINRAYSRCSIQSQSSHRRPSSSIEPVRREKGRWSLVGLVEEEDLEEEDEIDRANVEKIASENALLFKNIDQLLESSKRVHHPRMQYPNAKPKMSTIFSSAIKVKSISRKTVVPIEEEQSRHRPKSALVRVQQRLLELEKDEKKREALFQRVEAFENDRKIRMKEQLGKLQIRAQSRGIEHNRKMRTMKVHARQKKIQEKREEIVKEKIKRREKKLEKIEERKQIEKEKPKVFVRACDWRTISFHAVVMRLWVGEMLRKREERRVERMKRFRMRWAVRIIETKLFPAIRLWRKTALDRLRHVISRSYVAWSVGARIYRKRGAVTTLVNYLSALQGMSKYQRIMRRYLNKVRLAQITVRAFVLRNIARKGRVCHIMKEELFPRFLDEKSSQIFQRDHSEMMTSMSNGMRRSTKQREKTLGRILSGTKKDVIANIRRKVPRPADKEWDEMSRSIVRTYREERTIGFRKYADQMHEYWEAQRDAWAKERTRLILSEGASSLDVILAEEKFYEEFDGEKPSLEAVNEISVTPSKFVETYISFVKTYHHGAMTFLGFGKHV